MPKNSLVMSGFRSNLFSSPIRLDTLSDLSEQLIQEEGLNGYQERVVTILT